MFPTPPQAANALTEKPSLAMVRTAISTVLSQDANADRKSASDWLDALKNSFYAWEVCDQLLLARDSVEVSYLAAHMLRQKISKNFNELPLDCYSSLKDSILNHLQNHDDYAVQGQLTMAIADLTLLLSVWKNPIEDLAKQLGLDVGLVTIDINDQVALCKALNNRLIFAYIMHQMCDLNHHSSERPCKVGAKRREDFEDYLISKCKQSITWWLNTMKEIEELRAALQAQNNNTTLNIPTKQDTENTLVSKNIRYIDKLVGQIYLCYSAWLRIFNEEEVNDSLPLIDSSFKHLSNLDCPDTIHKFAVEVVIATANYAEDSGAVDYLVNHLVSQVYTLEPSFRQSVANEDLEKPSNFARTFTSVAETACLSHVIDNKDFKLVELLLSCLNHYDYEIVEETYSFWWLLLDHIQTKLKPEEQAPFIVYINKFILAVTKLCQFDPDEDSVIPQDQDIHSFRANTADIISNLMMVTTVEDFIRDNQILDNLKQSLSQMPWEKTEALLYLISCLVQMMSRTEHSLMANIIQSIFFQQSNGVSVETLLASKQVSMKIGNSPGEVHPQIVATTLRVLGSVENFLCDFPDYLTLAINYILNSISHPTYRGQLVLFAATALGQILAVNANRHFTSCPELLVIIRELCSNLDQFEKDATSELLKCGAYMADAIVDTSVKDQFLCQIIKPNLDALEKTLTPDGDISVAIEHLDRLSALFKLINLHPSIVPELKSFVQLVDSNLWPAIFKTLEIHSSKSERVIERTCRSLRYLLRCLKPDWMIQRVAETMIDLYKTHPTNSSPLYICSILVDEFANRTAEINQGLFNMLEIFCTLTFTLLDLNASQQKSLLTMKSYPETIDDMMRLFNRFMKKCPSEFVNCKALESIIELSISSLRIDHQEANESVTKFVSEFVELGKKGEYPHITDVIKNVLGARFVDAVIRASLFDIPPNLISNEAEILYELYEFDKNLFTTWVVATVSTLPKTNIQGIESVSADQLEDFKNTITTAGSLKKMVNCLRATARLYS